MAFAGLVGLVGLAGTACSGGDEGESSSSSGSPPPSTACAADTRKDIFIAGMAKPAGDLSVKIVQASPSPPAKGTNAMTLELVDGAGRPVDGATIVVTPFMPDHGHGSTVDPAITGAGGGKYEVSKIYLSMAGLWRITVTVTPPGGQAQDAVFQFCLDG